MVETRTEEVPETGAVERRLLLLEFVSEERWVFNGRFLPFFKGYAEKLCIDALWICYGKEIHTDKIGESDIRQYMRLDADELSALAVHVERLKPTHVVLSHAVADDVTALLREHNPGVVFVTMGEHSDQDGPPTVHAAMREVPWEELDESIMGGGTAEEVRSTFKHTTETQVSRTNWFLHWLGETPAANDDFGKFIVGTFMPSYDVIMANDAARGNEPHVIVMGGIACDHRVRVGKNEYYRDLDLTGCTHDFGCSYCTWYRGPTSDMKTAPVAIAEEQIRRLAETAGDGGRFCGRIELFDVRLFRRIDAFFEAVLAIPLAPTVFYFEPRLDRFLQVADKLEELFPRLAEAGHKVSILRMGVENLVEEENRRFNKFITLAEIDGGTRRLRELGERYPNAFEYDPTYGYITCTPWTTLEMLEEGIELAIERDFEPLGVWLYTPILLYRGSPITRLAEIEGDIITNEHEELGNLFEPAVNQVSFDSFIPWRYKDERTAAAFALIVRFCAASLLDKYPDTIFEGDELYSQMTENPSLQGRFTRPDLFAREAIAVVKGAEPPYDRIALLAPAAERYAGVVPVETTRQPNGDVPSDAPAVERYAGVVPVETTRQPHGDVPNDAPAQPVSDPLDPDPEGRYKLQYLLTAVLERFSQQFSDVTVGDIRIIECGAAYVLDIAVGGRDYRLHLNESGATDRLLFQTEHFAVSYDRDTPLKDRSDLAMIIRFLKVYNRAVVQYAPEVLPGWGRA